MNFVGGGVAMTLRWCGGVGAVAPPLYPALPRTAVLLLVTEPVTTPLPLPRCLALPLTRLPLALPLPVIVVDAFPACRPSPSPRPLAPFAAAHCLPPPAPPRFPRPTTVGYCGGVVDGVRYVDGVVDWWW